MLKQRLIFGFIMTVLLTGIVLFDGWLDGSIGEPGQAGEIFSGRTGTLFVIVVAILLMAAQLELAGLVEKVGGRVFLPVTIPASLLLASYWYLGQFFYMDLPAYFFSVLAAALLGLFLYQYFSCKTEKVIANCSSSLFSIVYLGVLSAFIVGIRIYYGPWKLLMFVFVVKTADIGAYTIGKLFGRHKFSPQISPGKTWEGMAGAVVAAVIVAVLFSQVFGIMNLWTAILFGISFAFIGQFGDLAESMIKRDAEQKDSVEAGSIGIPGFGGVLDVIDSPLGAGVFGYLFFTYIG